MMLTMQQKRLDKKHLIGYNTIKVSLRTYKRYFLTVQNWELFKEGSPNLTIKNWEL